MVCIEERARCVKVPARVIRTEVRVVKGMPRLYRSRCFSIDPRRLNKAAGFSIRSVWTRPVILSRFFPSLSDRPFSFSLPFPFSSSSSIARTSLSLSSQPLPIFGWPRGGNKSHARFVKKRKSYFGVSLLWHFLCLDRYISDACHSSLPCHEFSRCFIREWRKEISRSRFVASRRTNVR